MLLNSNKNAAKYNTALPQSTNYAEKLLSGAISGRLLKEVAFCPRQWLTK